MKSLLVGIVAALAATLPLAGAEPKSGDVVFAKLKQIVIPVIDFENTSLEEAIDFLRGRAIELDPEVNPSHRGVSIIIRYMREADIEQVPGIGDGSPYREIPEPIARYKAEKIPLPDALVEICRLTRFDAYIVICPLGQAPFPNGKGEKGEIWKKLTEPAPEPADKK